MTGRQWLIEAGCGGDESFNVVVYVLCSLASSDRRMGLKDRKDGERHLSHSPTVILAVAGKPVAQYVGSGPVIIPDSIIWEQTENALRL